MNRRYRLLALACFVVLSHAPARGVTPILVEDTKTIPAPGGSSPRDFAAAGGLVYFSAFTGESGFEPWRSDGTPAGTFQLADTCPGECGRGASVLAQGGGKVFLRVLVPDSPFLMYDLWITDGSTAGTSRLGGPFSLIDLPGRVLWVPGQRALYFSADDRQHGYELWRSDGTPEGTFALTDLRSGPEGSNPAELTALGGRVFFRADDGVRGPSLWSSDGTAAGTRLVLDPIEGRTNHAGPTSLHVVRGFLTFTAPATRQRVSLFRSDGTPAGTSAFFTLPFTEDMPAIGEQTVLGDRLLFLAFQASRGGELWISDGTAQGTRPLTRFRPEFPFLLARDISPFSKRPVNGKILFRADDGVHGFEPWATDGTPGGTRLLSDVRPGSDPGAGSFESGAVVSRAGGDLYFFDGDDGTRGSELWATDGTPAGTRLVRDLCRGECSSLPTTFLAANGGVYFAARDVHDVYQLWRSNGSSVGTVRLTPIAPTSTLGAPLGSSYLFQGSDPENGSQLWRTDGTAATTGLLVALPNDDLGGS